tara:strand:+ start:48 stop:617 length:570 start_codon:yes stop_codon:yes gene_type:complete
MSKTYIKNALFKNLLKCIFITPFAISFINPNTLKSGIEFQWDNSDSFKKLNWYQRDNKKMARNKIFLFLRKSDRKTGLLKVDVKVPKPFFKKIKEEKINLCQVEIGGFTKTTKCLVNIPADIELNKEKNTINIFPSSPIPSDKDNYAIVLNVVNPNRGGLYQFHSFGQSSGNIPVSFYIGSWTLKMQSQ